MTSPSRKRSSTEQAGPEERKRARVERDIESPDDAVPSEYVSSDATQTQAQLSRNRTKGGRNGIKQSKHVRKQHHVSTGADVNANIDSDTNNVIFPNSPTTPTPQTKRSSAHLDDTANNPELKTNSRAIYDANKEEIDAWCDKEYSLKLGIPKHGKLKRSNARWYEKLDTWQRAHDHAKSPKKKRKLNNGVAQAVEPPTLLTEKQRCEARLPKDKVAVPKYPFDKLEDFEPMPNGNYACAHVNRNPPGDCCKNGLTMRGKLDAIKKSIDVWKKQVERLIDQKKLVPAHKTWTNWVVEKLRKKYQPALYKKQEELKVEKVRAKREKEQEERERVEKKQAQKQAQKQAGERMRRSQTRTVQRQDSQRQPMQQYSTPAMRPYHQSPAQSAPAIVRPHPEPSHAVKARRAQTELIQVPPEDHIVTGVRMQRETSSALSQTASTPILRVQEVMPDVALRASPARPAKMMDAQDQYESHTSLQVWDCKTVDSTLDHSLSPSPILQQKSPILVSDSVPPQLTETRSETYYLSSLPSAFTTRDEIVDGGLGELLRNAYHTDSTWNNSPEDEQLLQKVVEQSTADWQRFCDFDDQL